MSRATSGLTVLASLASLLAPSLGSAAAGSKGGFARCGKPPRGMICIPGGTYVRGSNRNRHSSNRHRRAEYPRHQVILDTYYIDRREVSFGQYLRCMALRKCPKPAYIAKRGSSFRRRFQRPDSPFVPATWYMARAYCSWVGKRLPTEAEWEAAARGPRGETYPWGNSPPDCRKANHRIAPRGISYPRPRSRMRFCPPRGKGLSHVPFGRDQTWPVGSGTPYRGLWHMAGNGYEWVADLYDPHAYAACEGKPDCRLRNPHGPCPTGRAACVVKRSHRWRWSSRRRRLPGRRGRSGRVRRVWRRVRRVPRRVVRTHYQRHILKGGSWWWDADHLRAPRRRPEKPYTGTHRLSFRCVKRVKREPDSAASTLPNGRGRDGVYRGLKQASPPAAGVPRAASTGLRPRRRPPRSSATGAAPGPGAPHSCGTIDALATASSLV